MNYAGLKLGQTNEYQIRLFNSFSKINFRVKISIRYDFPSDSAQRRPNNTLVQIHKKPMQGIGF